MTKTKKIDEENIIKIGGNIKPLKDAVIAGAERVNAILDEVKALHDEVKSLHNEKNAIRSDLEAKGIQKKAFDKALKDIKLEPEQREAYDESYALCREFLGNPVGYQSEIFKDEKDMTSEG